ncbi:carbonic anhydrase [Coniochaeta ligniaria NRRL 30616]|uniref:carbonic anhydrase n=1 Tax=Coniochaeta ligniaria NRRL 30616 TaxID=1408157 RepID=A0A1J7IDL4_9PEZI|nr:carbonic anhydrase [Coniochaeta ligniaria NRRL 30616]
MASFLLKASLIVASAKHVLGSCSYGTFLHPRAEEGAPVPISKFGYAGAEGPLNWVALNPEANQACATGTKQSPIDMVDGVFQMVSATDLKLEIPDFADGTEFENLGTTVEIIAQGGSLLIANMTYEFKQAHFHLPSEHLDNGTSIAMEMHMVFQTAAQEIAVIGVFVDLDNGGAAPAPQGFLTTPMVTAPGVSSNVLETVFSKVGEIAAPGTSTKTAPLAMTEIVATLLTGSFQSYSGSLTTPPCSEGVRWLVATQKLQIQTATFEQVRDVIGFNARYPQNKPGQPNVLQLAAAAGAQAPIAA